MVSFMQIAITSNNNDNNKQDKQAWERVVALCLRWLSRSDPLYGL